MFAASAKQRSLKEESVSMNKTYFTFPLCFVRVTKERVRERKGDYTINLNNQQLDSRTMRMNGVGQKVELDESIYLTRNQHTTTAAASSSKKKKEKKNMRNRIRIDNGRTRIL